MKKLKLFSLALMALFATNVWSAVLTAHTPGTYEKSVATGGYGCTLTTIEEGSNAGSFEVYYFSALSKYGTTTNVYGGGDIQQYRLMCADGDSEYQLINTNGTSAFTKSCDWIEMAYTTTGFSKSDYTFGTAYDEFFAIAPNGGNSDITKTCYVKPKEGDVLTLKVSGYVEFAILGNDNGSSKYMTVTVDGGTPKSWKSNSLSRRSVELTTDEHTIIVANVGNSANAFYGFSLKLPAATKHTVTYDLNGATGTTPTQADVAEGAKFTLHNGISNITAPTNKDFAGWNDGTKTYAGGAQYTMGTSNVTLTAQWADHVANYTVIYKDGTTELGSETVEVGQHPTGSEIATPTKEFYTFAGWSPALSTVSGNDGDEVEVNATWTANYAFGAYSFNALTVGSTISKTITDKEVTYADAFRVDNFYFDAGIKIQGETGSAAEGEALDNYKGWKLKTSDKKIRFLVENNCQVKVAIGEKTDIKVTYTPLTGSETTVDQVKDNETPYLVKAGSLVTIKTTSDNTTTLKRLIITNVYNVTYTDTKGDASGDASNVSEVTLPAPSQTTVIVEDVKYVFTGWTADKLVTIGGVEKAAGTVLKAADVCVLSANTNFAAQWEVYVPSTDNEIKSLTIAGHDIVPSENIYSYEVGYDDESANVEVVYTIDARANGNPASGFKIDVPAAGALAATRVITVTAESGVQANYTVSVTKAAAASTDATLSDIKVDGVSIEGFDPATTNYEQKLTFALTLPTVTYTLADYKANAVHKVHNATRTDTIDVTAEDGKATKRYLVTFGKTSSELISISENATWDFTKTGAKSDIKLTNVTVPSRTEEFNFADVLADQETSFKAESLAGILEYVYRNQSSNKFCQGAQLRFITTVPGVLSVTYSNTGNREEGKGESRYLVVNGTQVGDSSLNATPMTTSNIAVAAGEVILTGKQKKDGVAKDLRIYKVVFTQTYPVNIALGIQNGTVTADKSLAAAGETVTLTATPVEGYKIASVKYNDGSDHVIEPVESVYSFTMPAAAVTVSATFYYPYVVTYDANGGTCATESQTFAGTALTLPEATNSPKYFAGWYDDAEAGNKIGMNGDAYIPTANIILYAHWSDTPTALDNTEDEVNAVKVLRDGQIFIEKNGHVYNVFGACVK